MTSHDAIHHTASSGRVRASPAFSELHDGRFCSLRLGQPLDDIAVILAGSAQRLELVNVGLLDTDDEAASRVSLRRRIVCALRKARLDYGVGGRGDGDADHGSDHTTTEWLRPETSILVTPQDTCSRAADGGTLGHRLGSKEGSRLRLGLIK